MEAGKWKLIEVREILEEDNKLTLGGRRENNRAIEDHKKFTIGSNKEIEGQKIER